ncbi:MAG: hypothetical protein IK015_09740 [Treponema sp.]|nr:hypothetical protein [Treponema sp.]
MAHEIGHCINDDLTNPLDVPLEIRNTLDRAYNKQCIERELLADYIGYQMVIGNTYFKTNHCDKNFIMTPKFWQNLLATNYVVCVQNMPNIKRALKANDFDHLLKLIRKFVTKESLRISTETPENQMRLKMFQNFYGDKNIFRGQPTSL